MMIIHLNMAVALHTMQPITTPMLRGTMVHVIGITTMVENVHRGFNGIQALGVLKAIEPIVNPYIYDANYCYNTWEGRIHIQIDRDGAFYDEDFFYDVSFTDSWSEEHTFFELPHGQYAIRLNFIEDGGSNWAWDISEEYRIECALDFTLENASAKLRPSSSDDIELNIVVHNRGECDGDFEVMVCTTKQINIGSRLSLTKVSITTWKEIRNPSWFNTTS